MNHHKMRKIRRIRFAYVHNILISKDEKSKFEKSSKQAIKTFNYESTEF